MWKFSWAVGICPRSQDVCWPLALLLFNLYWLTSGSMWNTNTNTNIQAGTPGYSRRRHFLIVPWMISAFFSLGKFQISSWLSRKLSPTKGSNLSSMVCENLNLSSILGFQSWKRNFLQMWQPRPQWLVTSSESHGWLMEEPRPEHTVIHS